MQFSGYAGNAYGYLVWNLRKNKEDRLVEILAEGGSKHKLFRGVNSTVDFLLHDGVLTDLETGIPLVHFGKMDSDVGMDES